MRVILLGSNGQLGSDIFRAHEADPRGFELVPLRRRDLDVGEIDRIAPTLAAHAFDVLINCTSYHNTDEVEKNAPQAFLINAHAVKAMAEACRVKGARFVHVSTDHVYGGGGGIRPYRESDCPSPVNVYGASKAMGETLARLAHDDALILRVASLFGIAGPSGKSGNFVDNMIRTGREKGELRVVNDQRMSPTSTEDIASMTISLIERRAPAGIYHAVNSGEATWYDFACAIISRAGIHARVSPIPSAEFPTVARRPSYSVLDNSKIASVVGDIPHWRDALDCYLRRKGHVLP